MSAHKVTRAAQPIVLLQAIGLVLGVTSQALIAHRFGTSRDLDLYAVALTIVAFIADWFLRDAVLFALVPKLRLAAVQHESESMRTRAEARRIAWGFVGGALAATALLLVAAPAVVSLAAPGLDGVELASAAALLRWLAPSLPCAALASLLGATLHARERFGLPALGIVLRSALIVVAVALGAGPMGIVVLPLAFTAGHLASVLIQAPAAGELASWWLGGRASAPSARGSYGGVLAYVAIGAAAYGNQLADRWFGSMLPEGALAELGYAERFRFPIMALFALSVSGPALSLLSDSSARRDLTELRATLRAAVGLISRTAWPALVVLLLLRHDLVALWLERGSFDPAATERVAGVLACLVPAFAVNVLSPLLLAAYFAQGVPRALVAIVCVEVALNVALDAWWVGPLGLEGLALATSAATALGNVVLWALLARRLGGLGGVPARATLVLMARLVVLGGAVTAAHAAAADAAPSVRVALALTAGAAAYLGPALASRARGAGARAKSG